MMKLAIMAAIAVALCTVSAEARPRQVQQKTITCDQRGCSDWQRAGTTSVPRERDQVAYSDARIVGGRPKGCPWRYCGCAVSLKVFGEIRRDLNLAYNWVRKFPRTRPAPGMVAARRGHVFYIQSVNSDGTVVAYDPNSGGHKTRIHTVSLRGFTVVDPHGTRTAMK
jgi:hypothetical protein